MGRIVNELMLGKFKIKHNEPLQYKYVKELKDNNVFSQIEKERNVKVSNTLRSLIKNANAGSPNRKLCIINKKERIIGSILSFNKGDTDSVFLAMDVVEDKNLLPFAIDPFGNYFCINKQNIVVFWDHETDNIESSKFTLEKFLNSLYEEDI